MASRVVTTLPYTEKDVAIGNFDKSRTTIDRVIIHTMIGTEASASARFANPTQQVSAHYGVRLDGKIIHWLEETFTAYHAGDYAMNQRSIGIEHEDNGDYNGVRTDALYETSSKLVRDICLFYNIPIDREHILKHSQVKATACPDALDIERIVRVAQGGNTPDTHADDLTKMLNWDQVCDYFKLDKTDKLGAKIVISKFETLKGIITGKKTEISVLQAQLNSQTTVPASVPSTHPTDNSNSDSTSGDTSGGTVVQPTDNTTSDTSGDSSGAGSPTDGTQTTSQDNIFTFIQHLLMKWFR